MIQALLETLLPSDDNSFTDYNFTDVFYPITVAALVLLVVAVVLYNVQVRRLHRHPPLVALQEWLLWTAVVVFGLVLIEAIFHFWFVAVVLTLLIGLGAFVWIRFFHFPPLIEAYNRQLRRARYMSQARTQARYVDPSSTVRAKKSSARRRRR